MVRPPFWVCQRLITLAVGHWPRLHGEALLAGVDLFGLPLDAFCDLVYAWATRDATPEQRDRFDTTLTQPPDGAGADRAGADAGWDDEAEAAEFLAAMRTHGVGAHMT